MDAKAVLPRFRSTRACAGGWGCFLGLPRPPLSPAPVPLPRRIGASGCSHGGVVSVGECGWSGPCGEEGNRGSGVGCGSEVGATVPDTVTVAEEPSGFATGGASRPSSRRSSVWGHMADLANGGEPGSSSSGDGESCAEGEGGGVGVKEMAVEGEIEPLTVGEPGRSARGENSGRCRSCGGLLLVCAGPGVGSRGRIGRPAKAGLWMIPAAAAGCGGGGRRATAAASADGGRLRPPLPPLDTTLAKGRLLTAQA